MTTQQQEQQIDTSQSLAKTRKWLSKRVVFISIVIIVAAVVATIWILSTLKIIPGPWATVFTSIVAVLGAVFAFLQVMHAASSSPQRLAPIIVQIPPIESLPPKPLFEKPAHRGIVGFPPLTDGRAIQQRKHIVKDVYTKLMQDDIAAIALTGIGGVGKSTLAALIYRYAEDRRHNHSDPFLAETIWLTVDPAVTFADLAGNLFEALHKPLPDLGSLASQNQAIALFNALNGTDKPRLIILDQFENLLDWDTGHALTDRPGVGEWLDIINSQPCACRVLLTSRPRPVGTRKYPQTYLQEYAVGGLEADEGIALLQSQGVQGTGIELQTAVSYCAGHAFSLTLLATLMRDHHMNLTTLFKNPTYWTGDIATNLLDQIYIQKLNDAQRIVLQAFSVYRKPVQLEAVQAVVSQTSKGQVPASLKALLIQHLIEPIGEGRYQLHTIITDYALGRFDESSEQANEEAVRSMHLRAAEYYLQRSAIASPPRGKRRMVNDIRDLIEAIWQLCEGEKWQAAYDVIEREGIFPDLNRWGGNAVLLELCQLLLPSEKWHPQLLQEASIYNNLGEVFRALGQIERAQVYHEQALQISKEIRDREGEGLALNALGRIYSLRQGEQALDYFEQALSIYQELKNQEGEELVLNNLGGFYKLLGLKEQAQEYFNQALHICREIGDRGGEGHALGNLGGVHNMLGQKEQALDYLNQALNISRVVGDRGLEGWTLNYLGKIYHDLGQRKQSLGYFEQALYIRREHRNRLGEGRTLKNLGEYYRATGEYERALECLNVALKISREAGDRIGEGRALNNLGRVYDGLGMQGEALKYHEASLHIWKEIDSRGAEGWSLKNLGDVYSALQKGEESLKYLEEAWLIFREVGDRWGEGEALHSIGKLYFAQNIYEVALSCFVLAKKTLSELQNQLHEETQIWIEKIQNELGEEQFAALLITLGANTQEIVE